MFFILILSAPSRALKIEKLKAPLFRGPEGAGATNDWCIMYTPVNLSYYIKVGCKGSSLQGLVFVMNVGMVSYPNHTFPRQAY